MAVDWSELPRELVLLIAENYLDSVEDFVVVSSVCRSWHRAIASCDKTKLQQTWTRQMPWLMLTDGNLDRFSYYSDTDEEDEFYYAPGELDSVKEEHNYYNCIGKEEMAENASYNRPFLNLSRNKRYTLSCPQGYGRVCWGSALGWIVTAGLDHNMYLFNPITKSRLDLPSQVSLPKLWKSTNKLLRLCFIRKAVVLKVPSDLYLINGKESILVAVIYNGGRKVAIAQPGDTRWTPIKKTLPGDRFMHDVAYHHGQDLLLFAGLSGSLSYCNLRESKKPLLRHWYCPKPAIVDTDMIHDVFSVNYIVNSGKDLLMVSRTKFYQGGLYTSYVFSYKTLDFEVYKLDFDTKVWVKLSDLLDIALFVGNNSTMAVNALEAGCQHNCIYFTDDYDIKEFRGLKDGLGGNDIGVFKMDDRSIITFCEGSNLRSSYSCPSWFIPSF